MRLAAGVDPFKVTEAEIVYVHVDRNNKPLPLGGEEGEETRTGTD